MMMEVIRKEREKRSDEKNMVIITVAGAINTKKPTQCGQQLDMVAEKWLDEDFAFLLLQMPCGIKE